MTEMVLGTLPPSVSLKVFDNRKHPKTPCAGMPVGVFKSPPTNQSPQPNSEIPCAGSPVGVLKSSTIESVLLGQQAPSQRVESSAPRATGRRPRFNGSLIIANCPATSPWELRHRHIGRSDQSRYSGTKSVTQPSQQSHPVTAISARSCHRLTKWGDISCPDARKSNHMKHFKKKEGPDKVSSFSSFTVDCCFGPLLASKDLW